ncbi:MAG TPA: cytochrome c biogenesis protein CcsA [Candidatus Sulfotelmatobacter sp.]|jgi:ABC-type transport system involved in cytochrome c biogenesis permease subunit|nr:cytochrome c biogenesis protein CcsA [Candidatus Sulfotelmatobacter sp.]
MARTRVEIQPATGTTLVVLVGLGVSFLLLMALLSTAKSENLWDESYLLFGALIFYSAAAVLYLGFGVTGLSSYVRFASFATWAGLIANTGAVARRWYEAGHPPFASVYEMLLSFVWTLAVLTLIAEKRYGVKIIGTVTMPVAIVGVVLMQLLRTEVHPLVPALQSTWLHVHVTLAMLAYAACALSFALAMMFLIQDKMQTETFLAATSLFAMAIYVAVLTRFEKWGGLSVVAWNPQEKSEAFLARGIRLFVVIPDLGWMMLVVLGAVSAPFFFYLLWRRIADDRFLSLANRAEFVSILLQVLALVFFLLRVRDGRYRSLDADGLFPTNLAASPFLLSGLVGGVFASLLYLLLLWRREDLERMLPSAKELDRITYRTIAIAFPLLTLMIAAGAYWANRTWGSYWSWDPKETWAAITWLVYAGYLHTRITRGWRGRRAAYFAIFGFGVVMFTFFGVTYLLPGLHAYA